jgi:hypothetical protein
MATSERDEPRIFLEDCHRRHDDEHDIAGEKIALLHFPNPEFADHNGLIEFNKLCL